MFDKFRKRLFGILEFAVGGDWIARFADVFIMSLILLNVAALILDTVPEVHAAYRFWFFAFEAVSVITFTIEYVLRLWSCTSDPRFARPVLGRLRYAVTPLALVDLVSVLPFYLRFMRVDLRFMRSLRIARIFRVFKLARYMKSISLIGDVIREKRGELVMTLIFSGMLLILSSSLMYYVEHGAAVNVEKKAFTSIPDTMWWAMQTLTTLGYGDVVPATTLGRFLGAIVALTGVGMFALPTAILGSGFIEVVRRENDRTRVCPHCGKPLA